MMSNLFTIFDPSSSFTWFSSGWLNLIIGLVFMNFMYWASVSRFHSLWSVFIKGLLTEMELIIPKMARSTIIFPITIFFLVLYCNLTGLLCHVFTSTSHLTVTLSLSLPLWLGMMCWSVTNNLTHLMSHLVPQGTPSVLMPFMVVIESISNIIRPLTLAVRLSANMIAGHLLLALMSGAVEFVGVSCWLSPVFIGLQLLSILEMAVAAIQAYVFATLFSLYMSEV